MRVVANLSLMFKNSPLLERYALASRFGFKLVELPFGYSESKEALKKAADANGLQHILINAKNDDKLGGLACRKEHLEKFRENIDLTLSYAKCLNVRIVHVMAGDGNAEDEPTFVENLKYASKLFAEHGILCVIEPLNPRNFPHYFLNSYEQAKRIIENANEPNLKILYDVYHAQLICGQITHTLKTLHPLIGHIQVSQPPGRHEPDSQGEVNFEYFFNLLKELNSDWYIGAEYLETMDNVDWVQKYGLSF